MLILILQLTPMGSRELYNQLRLEEITKAWFIDRLEQYVGTSQKLTAAATLQPH